MDIGRLRNLVTLQHRVDGHDAAGQAIGDWLDISQVWADIRYPSGLESVRSGAVVSVGKASVRIRWRADVTTGMRIFSEARALDIKAVLPDSQRRYVDLVCEVIS